MFDAALARRFALPVLAALGLGLGACSTASLVSPGDDPFGSFEQRLIGNTLAGLGLIPGQRERIDYAPRPPLAMPPLRAQTQLRPPEAPGQIAANQPNWPRDPDVLRREAAAREAADPGLATQREYNSYRRLSPEEMEALKSSAPNGTQVASSTPAWRENGGRVLGREELERGWADAPTDGSGLFQVDETVDVVAQNQERRSGPSRLEVDERSGAPGVNRNANPTTRIDTTRLASATAPERRSIVDPPGDLRTPAPDPTNGVVTEDKRTWLEKLFNR